MNEMGRALATVAIWGAVSYIGTSGIGGWLFWVVLFAMIATAEVWAESQSRPLLTIESTGKEE